MEKLWVFILAGIVISALVVGALLLAFRKSPLQKVWPRLFGWVLLSTLVFAGLFFVAPQQAAVAYYKFALAIGAAILGYWLDRATFPYARPDGYLKDFWQKGTTEPLNQADYEVVAEYKTIFALVMLRRAILMAAVILGVTLGL